MVAKLRAKPGADRIGVTIGDFATTRVDGTFALAYLVYNTIMNLTTQDEQVECFRNVADRHADPIRAWLRAQLGDHRGRQVDPVHPHAPPAERQRDPAGADAELKDSAVSRQIGEEADDRIDGRRQEHVSLVVPLRDPFVEVVRWLGHQPLRFNRPVRFA
jgi:hypothetical protein